MVTLLPRIYRGVVYDGRVIAYKVVALLGVMVLEAMNMQALVSTDPSLSLSLSNQWIYCKL